MFRFYSKNKTQLSNKLFVLHFGQRNILNKTETQRRKHKGFKGSKLCCSPAVRTENRACLTVNPVPHDCHVIRTTNPTFIPLHLITFKRIAELSLKVLKADPPNLRRTSDTRTLQKVLFCYNVRTKPLPVISTTHEGKPNRKGSLDIR